MAAFHDVIAESFSYLIATTCNKTFSKEKVWKKYFVTFFS